MCPYKQQCAKRGFYNYLFQFYFIDHLCITPNLSETNDIKDFSKLKRLIPGWNLESTPVYFMLFACKNYEWRSRIRTCQPRGTCVWYLCIHTSKTRSACAGVEMIIDKITYSKMQTRWTVTRVDAFVTILALPTCHKWRISWNYKHYNPWTITTFNKWMINNIVVLSTKWFHTCVTNFWAIDWATGKVTWWSAVRITLGTEIIVITVNFHIHT